MIGVVAARSMAIALVLAALIAGVFTFESWDSNPGGIFQTEQGTQWSFVIDTFASWFFPSAVLAFAVLFVVVLGWCWAFQRENDREQ